MTTIPKGRLVFDMQALGEKLSELAKTFSDDVQLTICASSNGYISISGTVFDDNGENAKVSGMPIRRYYTTAFKEWKEDKEDAYPEVGKKTED